MPSHRIAHFVSAGTLADSQNCALLILAGIWILAWAWGVGLHNLADNENVLTKAARVVLYRLINLLVADLAWQPFKTLINEFFRKAVVPSETGSQDNAIDGTLASGFTTAERHHLMGRDRIGLQDGTGKEDYMGPKIKLWAFR